MKIVYFGSDVFLPTFRFMLSEHKILALYTYHNDEDYFNEYQIVKLAREHEIPVHYECITKYRMKQYIEHGARLFYSAEYDRRIPVPDDPGVRAVNTHSSLLPEGRSYYPIEVALYNGLKRTGVTLHKLAYEFDRGEILLQESFPIEPEESSVDIYRKSASAALRMTKMLLADFDGCWALAKPQTKILPYWKRPPGGAMLITHDMTVAEAVGVYRCFNKMTKVEIKEELFYVDSLNAENLVIHNFVRVDARSGLFGLKNGHIHIGIVPVIGGA